MTQVTKITKEQEAQFKQEVGRGLIADEIESLRKGTPFSEILSQGNRRKKAVSRASIEVKGYEDVMKVRPLWPEEEARYKAFKKDLEDFAPTKATSTETETAIESKQVASGTGEKEMGKFKSDIITRDDLDEPADPFVTGEKPLPPGFKLATEPKSGKTIPIPETHTFDAQGNLVLFNQPFIPSTGVPGDQGQMGKFRSDIVTRDALSNLKFNTGNPSLDDFLNNTWVPLLRAETQSLTNPQDILNPEIFAKIKERVNTTWGPIFQKELQLVEESFGRSQAELTAGKEETLAELKRTRQRTIEEEGIQRGRTIEESGILKDRIARNYSQALEESKASFASRGLAFSGIRGEFERRLEEERSERTFDVERGTSQQLADLTRQRERTLEDILTGEQSTQGAFGRGLEELQAGFTEQKRGIEGERTLQEAQERARLRSLGGDILQNPELFNF